MRMGRRKRRRSFKRMMRKYWRAMNRTGWNMVGWKIIFLRRLIFGLVYTATAIPFILMMFWIAIIFN